MNQNSDNITHPWNVDYKTAVKIQDSLHDRWTEEPLSGTIKTVAGADVGISARLKTSFCAIAVFDYPELKTKNVFRSRRKLTYPYIPGLLTFREGPVFMQTWRKIKQKPDLIVFDGQGIAHPRRMGLAAHLGILLDRPSIGCAKSRLIGEYEEPGQEKGSFEYLTHEGKIIGAVVRTRTGVKPVFVSQGYRITLKEAVKIVLQLCTKYRLTEPVRAAHHETRMMLKEYKEQITTEDPSV